jgi:O-methyltransferase
MLHILKRAIVGTSLEKPARLAWAVTKAPIRKAWLALQARGLAPWASLVPEDAFTECVQSAVGKLLDLEPSHEIGDYLEFGVSRGTSLACVHWVLDHMGLDHVRLIGFDSFQGMPRGSAEEGWATGAFHSTLAATRHYLEGRGISWKRVVLVEGWFNDTLTPKTRTDLGLGKASLIMIDCDIYSASKAALAFCEPHIRGHAVIIFDDWGSAMDMGKVGQREVFEEFLADHSDVEAEPLPAYNTNSRVFLVRRRAGANPVG